MPRTALGPVHTDEALVVPTAATPTLPPVHLRSPPEARCRVRVLGSKAYIASGPPLAHDPKPPHHTWRTPWVPPAPSQRRLPRSPPSANSKPPTPRTPSTSEAIFGSSLETAPAELPLTRAAISGAISGVAPFGAPAPSEPPPGLPASDADLPPEALQSLPRAHPETGAQNLAAPLRLPRAAPDATAAQHRATSAPP